MDPRYDHAQSLGSKPLPLLAGEVAVMPTRSLKHVRWLLGEIAKLAALSALAGLAVWIF